MSHGREHGVKMGIGGQATADMMARHKRAHREKLIEEVSGVRDDPYLEKNDMGQFECVLCKTTHRTIESYIQHTEGKKHKESLSVRQFHQEKMKNSKNPLAQSVVAGMTGHHTSSSIFGQTAIQKAQKAFKREPIGTPAYQVLKQYDQQTGSHAIAFKIEYPLITKGIRPRYSILSTYQQDVEPPDDRFKFIVFAAEPYTNIAIKIPNVPHDLQKRFVRDWDPTTNTFILQLGFQDDFNGAWRKKQSILGPSSLLMSNAVNTTVTSVPSTVNTGTQPKKLPLLASTPTSKAETVDDID